MQKKRTFMRCFCLLLLVSSLLVSSFTVYADTEASKNGKYSFVDSHLHYLDFLQKTDGFDKLVKEMDEANVRQAVLFGMPMSKQWDDSTEIQPSYYLSNDARCYYFTGTDYIVARDLSLQTAATRSRFLPFASGVNSNDRRAAEYLEQLFQLYPDTFVGIGEIMSRHDDLTALTYGEPPKADSAAFKTIYDLAAEYNMPVLIHHNISGSYMDNPIYLEEMKNALEHNEKTNIIWAHMGISRRVEISNLIPIFEDLFKNYPNLYVDISWVVYDDYIGKDVKSLDKWAKFIEEYSDRFMIGTDVVGHWGSYTKTIEKYYPLLDKLSPTTAEKITQGNILKLIPLRTK